MSDVEEVVQAAVSLFVGRILDLLQADPHQWSKRPCATCQTISVLAHRPFGCVKKATEP